jgi:transcriptional regulator with XRE-family HTH domain
MTAPFKDVGSGLRHAREQSGLTLQQMAAATKLSVRNLSALENNRIEQLPGGIYRRAIVRSYAAQVGLDPEQTLRAFLAKYPDDVPTWADLLPARQPLTLRRAVHAIIGVLGTLVPIFAGAFYFIGNVSGPSAQPRPIAALTRAEVLQSSMMPASLPRGGNSVPMIVSVSSPTFLQIMSDGREVVARLVGAGETLRLHLSRDVVLMGDNAGAVHFSINGRAGRSLGDAGEPLSVRIFRQDYQRWLMRP